MGWAESINNKHQLSLYGAFFDSGGPLAGGLHPTHPVATSIVYRDHPSIGGRQAMPASPPAWENTAKPTKPEGLPNPAAFLNEMYANSEPLLEPSDYDGGDFYDNDVPDGEGDGFGDVAALRGEVAELRASVDRLAETVGSMSAMLSDVLGLIVDRQDEVGQSIERSTAGLQRLRKEFLRFVESMEKGLAGNAAKGGRR